MTRRVIQIFVVILLVFASIAAYWFWSPTRRKLEEPYLHYASEQVRTLWSGDLIQRESRKIVGSAAVDCGFAPLGTSRAEVEHCISQSWSAKRAFKGRWDVQNFIFPPVVQDGLLGTKDGRLYHFRYQEGPHIGEEDYREISIKECPKPFKVVPDDVTGILGCYACDPGVFHAPAIYFEHVGDEDKPIYPIVIATKQPTEEELRCGSRYAWDSWLGNPVFIVTDEELAHVLRLLTDEKPQKIASLNPKLRWRAKEAEFGYVFSSAPGTAEAGVLMLPQSLHLLSALSEYFKDRQLPLHETLIKTRKRFRGTAADE